MATATVRGDIAVGDRASGPIPDPAADEPAAQLTVVIPTLVRASLQPLLATLATELPHDVEVLVVDDRTDDAGGLLALPPGLRARVLRSHGHGPAAARNLGWRTSRTPWVVFLDDDVLPAPGWFPALLEDLDRAQTSTVAIQGEIRVPLRTDRRPTDWERTTAGLETARLITADLAVRREALSRIGGFDERFRRAYREDTDLALRLGAEGRLLVRGERRTRHPVRPADAWVSVRAQAGNADDQLMRRLHGRDWRHHATVPRGRFRRHAVIVGAAAAAGIGALSGRRRLTALGASLAALGILELGIARVLPGPRTPGEIARSVATSPVLPFAAVAHGALGAWRHRHARPWAGVPDLVLFDRDGTLIDDVPYNGDPERVRAVPAAAPALALLRDAGVRIGLITNQSAVGRGLIGEDDAHAVNARVADLLGPFDVELMCPHTPDDGCGCRKPAPGLVYDACRRLGVAPGRVAVVGDTAGDVEAAERAGGIGVLVPNAATAARELTTATHLATDLVAAARLLLDGGRRSVPHAARRTARPRLARPRTGRWRSRSVRSHQRVDNERIGEKA